MRPFRLSSCACVSRRLRTPYQRHTVILPLALCVLASTSQAQNRRDPRGTTTPASERGLFSVEQLEHQGVLAFPHPEPTPVDTDSDFNPRVTRPQSVVSRPVPRSEAPASIIRVQGGTSSPKPKTTVRKAVAITLAPPATALMTLADVYPWMRRIQNRFPDRVSLQALAVTVQGRPVVAVQITPPDVEASQLRRLAIICRQHGDEPDTTAAGAEFIYRALTNKLPDGAAGRLQQVAVLVVPVANPDGAVKKTRHNAARQDLNRDWGNWNTREAAAIGQLLQSWQPHLVVDVHQWVPGDRTQTPMAEASGGGLGNQAAALMSQRARAKGFRLAYRTHGRGGSLAHRHWAANGVPGILLETIHRPKSPKHRSIAINTSIIALSSALEVVANSRNRPWWTR